MTEIVPQRTNLVKLSHVFLWFSLSINYFCLALNFGFFLFIMYTLPLLLTNFELRSLFFNDLRELFIFIINQPGNVLLFHVLRQSTIGAERLDFRVRNGIGYDPFAINTRQQSYTSKIEFVNVNYSTINLIFITFFEYLCCS